MIVSSHTVPFVDLTLPHQPIQAEIEQAMAAVVQRGDFILGKSLKPRFRTSKSSIKYYKPGVNN